MRILILRVRILSFFDAMRKWNGEVTKIGLGDRWRFSLGFSVLRIQVRILKLRMKMRIHSKIFILNITQRNKENKVFSGHWPTFRHIDVASVAKVATKMRRRTVCPTVKCRPRKKWPHDEKFELVASDPKKPKSPKMTTIPKCHYMFKCLRHSMAEAKLLQQARQTERKMFKMWSTKSPWKITVEELELGFQN